MTNCQEARVKLTNTQLNKVNFAAKNRAGTILRINKKNFEDEELPHELFLTARETVKLKYLKYDSIWWISLWHVR